MNPPCRLVFLIRDLGHGGAQRQLVMLAKGLSADTRFQVSVVHFYPGVFETELREAGIQTFCVGKRHRWDLAGFFGRLTGVMRTLRPDVIHGYLHESNLMALCLKPLCGFPRVLWGIRDSRTDAATWGLLGRLSFWLNCLLSGKADLIIANSRAGRAYYIAQGYPERGFEVVANGIDVDRFQPSAETRSGEVVQPCFAMVGRLHPMKDHKTFLKALAEVPDVRAVILGGGDATSYVQGLQQLAESLGIASRVDWQAAQADLAPFYARVNCLVSASSYGEGFSNVIGEAMACGLPVIASDVGDSAWLVGNSLWEFPAGDHKLLAAQMRLMTAMSPQERAELGRTNRQRIVQEFTVSRMLERTASMILAAIHSGAGLREADQPAFSTLDAVGGGRGSDVLWLTTGLGTGGAEMMLTQLVTGLPMHRHHVISLTSGGKHAELLRAAGAHVYSLDMPAGRPTFLALARLFRLARQIQPEVIMGWMYHGCLAAVLVKLFLLGKGCVIWNIRQSLYDLGLEKRGSALVIRSLAWLAPFAKAVTYNSRVSALQHEAIGYPVMKRMLIPNGFDLSQWSPVEETKRLRLTVRKNGGESLYVGRFGRFSAMKDYSTFLEAAALVVKDLPQVEFVLAGTGVDASNVDLVRQVQRLGLQDQVHLLGERFDLPLLTASLDLAVSSSSFGEGFPNVVGEAMACGVPVVATDIGDTAWVMGATGARVPARDAAKLAEACLAVLKSSPEERVQAGRKGRLRIEDEFSLADVLRKFGALIQPTNQL